jgi:hypothetical protein
MVLAGIGTILWFIPSLFLGMANDNGAMNSTFFSLFMLVAVAGPPIATFVSIVWGIARLRDGMLGTWWRVLLVQLSAPVVALLFALLGSVA